MRIGLTALAVVLVVACPVMADSTITANNTATIASSGPWLDPTGTHFHNQGGDPAVGTLDGSEEIRGIVEFDLTTASASNNVSFTFEVTALTGYVGQSGPGSFVVFVQPYTADGVNSISDYSVGAGSIGNFSTAGRVVGSTITFTMLPGYNGNVGGYLGVRFRAISDPGTSVAIRLGNFRITVPEPGFLVLAAVGVGGVILRRRRRRTV